MLSEALITQHGLTLKEFQDIVTLLGREPNVTELGIFSVMWSEHCSYKSSKKWLKTLPVSAPWVICGPGENAGVIDIGDNQALVFKMESHNHPSYIEPEQGAATGVGGILRDVFTMGARPIALLNALRFGEPSHPKTKYLVEGVVRGIGFYGNCVGVPTVGGECNFHKSYNGNNLVNAMAVGLADKRKIFYSAAAGIGNQVVYVGAKTGRDGIHGATMASAEFSGASEEKRPTVQVGDPFVEKLLIEACLELMESEAIIAIQDMGAAGLTSSSIEMALKGQVGLEMNLDLVPMRESEMSAYEIMLSESQERMLMILAPDKSDLAATIFHKWGLDFAVIGQLCAHKNFILTRNGQVVVDLPLKALEESPEYERPFLKPPIAAYLNPEDLQLDAQQSDLLVSLQKLLSCPDLASKRWIYEQYDYMVRCNTLIKPATADAAVVRIEGEGFKAIALSSDVTPRYCMGDPREGARQAVAEVWRNLTAVGAKPLAITDNLNFGNPGKPEIMGQIIESIAGIGEACRDLNFPVVSGNVSLYNETDGVAIFPTPTIGGVGLLEDYRKATSLDFKQVGSAIVLIGESKGWLGASLYLREILGREDGAPPKVLLHREKRHGDLTRTLIEAGLVLACHDISDGGLLVAVSEMAMASKDNIGADLITPSHNHAIGWYFGEDQGRYVLEVDQENLTEALALSEAKNVPARVIGKTRADDLVIDKQTIDIERLRQLNESWFPNFMAR